MLLSIVITAFNSENTIIPCVESICRIKEPKVQIIVVNDGSTDNTESRIFDVIHLDERLEYYKIENNGVSYARNYGIGKSIGKYITFVDSDDYINNIMFDYIIDKVLINNYEFITCDYLDLGNNTIVSKKTLKSGENKIIHAAIELLEGESNHVWANIYDRQVLIENNIVFDTAMSMGEDGAFNTNYILCCNKCFYIRDPIYFYNSKNNKSAMHKHPIKYLNDYILLFDSYKKLVNEFQGISISVKKKQYYLSEFFKCLLSSKGFEIYGISGNRIVESWFYKQIMEQKYKSIKCMVKKSYIKWAIKHLPHNVG